MIKKLRNEEEMMKSTNYSNGKIAKKAIIVILSLLISNMIANAQVFQIGNREYRFKDSKWFNYSSGIKGDIIVPDRLIVRLASREKPVTSDFKNLGISGVNVISRRLLGDYYVLEIAPNVDPFNVVQTLFQSAVFEYVEFDALGTYAATPQDPYFPEQWNLDDTKLRMELAWDLSSGDNSVILAIIDSGTEYDHEDLDNNIWNNSDELPGDGNSDGYPGVAGVDDDGDGLIDEDSQGLQPGEPGYTNDLFEDDDENVFIDDFYGWDFADDDNSPISTNYHGTAVAGIAGAQTHNCENGVYTGIAGIAGGWKTKPGVSLMILKVLFNIPDLFVFASATAECITYASENGADVMNMSWGWYNFYDWYEDVVNEAVNDYDCILVACSHNFNRDITFPAKYANTIAVGATDENDVRRPYSNYGPELDVVAPSHVPTTTLNNGYIDEFTGTSASAPHVAGLAALIRSINPNISWVQVRNVIRSTADKVAGMDEDFTVYYGYGRINAYKALKYTLENYGGTLSGEVIFHENITIKQGATLTILPGTIVYFNPYIKLTVNGTLDAQGTSDNPIVLTRSDPDNHDYVYWEGIWVNSNGSFNLDHVYVYGAHCGVYSSYASGSIKNSHFEENSFGTYINQSDNIEISNSKFINNNWFGACIGYSDGLNINNNEFIENENGVILNRSTGNLCENIIRDNNNQGIGSENIGDPNLSTARYRPDTYPPEVNNVIENNSQYGVYISSNSSANLGTMSGDPRYILCGGFNYFNRLSGSYDVYNNSSNAILAQVNWWGSMHNYGNIWVVPKAEEFCFPLPKPTSSKTPDILTLLLIEAYSLEVDSLYVEAIEVFNNIINTAPDNSIIYPSISGIVRNYKRLNDINELIANLDDLHTRYSYKLAGITAYDYSVTIFAGERDFDEALSRSEEVVKIYTSDRRKNEEAAWAIFEQGTIYEIMITELNCGLGKSSDALMLQAKTMQNFSRVVKDYPESEASELVRALYGEDLPYVEQIVIPENFTLHPIYPNPFNATTTICFDLPEPAKVNLKIYDILGVEVWSMESRNTRYEAGSHSIIWSGTNRQGLPLSTGLYLIRLTIHKFSETQKVLLLK
ncbi:S8 family serine peptidase [bacterium]|nr:S8 family serine peptidase [bacterium]MBU1634587.1 S8 family serine peptidase [bacterium]MBU1872402.1 S8 family serine peptidase [bacterium]